MDTESGKTVPAAHLFGDLSERKSLRVTHKHQPRTYVWSDIIRYLNRAGKADMGPKERETFCRNALNAWGQMARLLSPEKRLTFLKKTERALKLYQHPIPDWNPALSPDGKVLVPNYGPFAVHLREIRDLARTAPDPTAFLNERFAKFGQTMAEDMELSKYDIVGVRLRDFGSHATWLVTYPDNSTREVSVDSASNNERDVLRVAARQWRLLLRIEEYAGGLVVKDTGIRIGAVAKLIATGADDAAIHEAFPKLTPLDIEAVHFYYDDAPDIVGREMERYGDAKEEPREAVPVVEDSKSEGATAPDA